MKKIYISVDVEGLNGVANIRQIEPSSQNQVYYEEMRTQLHLELNSLIKGLKEAGVEEITVNDAHGTMDNILLNSIPSDVKLISGKPKPVSMMFGLDESYDGVAFLGYHAKEGAKGTLAHTFNMKIEYVKINDIFFSEAMLNAYCATLKGVPVIFASGDDVFCTEFLEDIGATTFLQTKKAVSFTCCECKINDELQKEYIETAKKAVKSPVRAEYKLSSPYTIKVKLKDFDLNKKVAEKIGISLINDEICLSSEDYFECYKFLQKISANS